MASEAHQARTGPYTRLCVARGELRGATWSFSEHYRSTWRGPESRQRLLDVSQPAFPWWCGPFNGNSHRISRFASAGSGGGGWGCGIGLLPDNWMDDGEQLHGINIRQPG
jgi:hypothetical protein